MCIRDRANFVALLVRADRLLQLHGAARLAPGAKLHENLVFNAARSVGRQLSRLWAEGVYRFNQADRADGNHIVRIQGAALVFFGDVRHQAQIVFDQSVTRGRVPLPHAPDQLGFLCGGKGLGK